MVSGFTSTKFTGTFDLTGAVAGRYNLTVTNPGGPNATKVNAFTVNSPSDSPTIVNCSPASGVNIAVQPCVLNGTNFRAGATVTITNRSSTKTVAATSVTSSQLKCSLPLTGLPIGLYNLTVLNTDGTNATEPGAFTVLNPRPTVTVVTPVSGYNTGTVMATITGTKFVQGASIILTNQTRNIIGTVISVSATSIKGSFPLTAAVPGIYNLTVSNPGDANGTRQNAFSIQNPGINPVISTLNPASGFNNGNLPVTITGLNFRTAKVYLNQGSLLKLATPTAGKVSTATLLYVTLPLTGVPGGLYNLTVSNSDGVNVTGHDIFYVTDQAWISKGPKANSRPVVQKAGVPFNKDHGKPTGCWRSVRPVCGV